MGMGGMGEKGWDGWGWVGWVRKSGMDGNKWRLVGLGGDR